MNQIKVLVLSYILPEIEKYLANRLGASKYSNSSCGWANMCSTLSEKLRLIFVVESDFPSQRFDLHLRICVHTDASPVLRMPFLPYPYQANFSSLVASPQK